MLRAGVTPARLAVGTGCPAIADTVALTKGVLDQGITQVLLLPPYTSRVSAEGIEDAFAKVLDRVAHPQLSVCLYHIPRCAASAYPRQCWVGCVPDTARPCRG